MTKEEWLDRCATAWDAGYINDDSLRIARLYIDVCGRIAHYILSSKMTPVIYPGDIHQADIAGDELAADILSRQVPLSSANFSYSLANDRPYMDACGLSSLLAHPCQICATNKSEWHTRWGFCPHKKRTNMEGECRG